MAALRGSLVPQCVQHVPEEAHQTARRHAQSRSRLGGLESCFREKQSVQVKLRELKLDKIADFIQESIEETLNHMYFPREHWSKLRTNNMLDVSCVRFDDELEWSGVFPMVLPL